MTDRALLQQALDALEADDSKLWPSDKRTEAITTLRERLAQPEQEPVAHTLNCVCGAVWDIKADGSEEMAHTPDTTPPQRKPLPPQSPCEMTQAEGKMFKLGWLECEAAHGIKGEA